jgi:hypothetical protein
VLLVGVPPEQLTFIVTVAVPASKVTLATAAGPRTTWPWATAYPGAGLQEIR